MLKVNEETCVGCGWCQTFCPRDALLAWGLLKIEHEKCDRCLACIECCPTNSLSMVEGAAT